MWYWRRQWHPTPVLLSGKSNGQRSLVDYSPWGHEKLDTTERLHFHFSLSCIGEGNGNLLQCSCLENPLDGGTWWAAIYGVAQSRTWLKRLSSGSSSIMWYCQFLPFFQFLPYSLLYVFKCFYVWYMCLQILYLLVELIPWSLHNVFICLLLKRVKVFFIWYKYCYPGFNFHFHFSHPLIFSLCSSLDLKWVSYRHYMCLTRWRNMTYRSYFFI